MTTRTRPADRRATAQAIVTGAGFGQAIRSINGAVECNGRNTAEMQDRVNQYQRFARILRTSPGTNLTC